MADSQRKSSPAETILYLRPQRDETIAALDLEDNKLYQDEVAPPPDPTDIPLDGISENPSTSHLSPHYMSHDSVSRETTPGLYTICPRITHYVNKSKDKNRNYFRIHYNFNSGALLITAIEKIRIGHAVLGKNESLLLMAGISIECGGVFEFIVEFPDLRSCAKEHERNYQEYAAKLGIPDAQYMATPLDEDIPIGREHRSKAILGKGAFGEVHKAVNNKTGDQFAIKILSEGGEREMKEVNIMSKLYHENIIKYERAFKLPSGQICIVMELAVNDLHTHQKAREKGKRKSYFPMHCIRSIGRQALSALDYLHNNGFTHRDLKPTNILVTKWNAETDIPNIKLADFGLAGIRSENSMHTTFCGTDGYIAPEVIRGQKRLEELQKQKDKGMETVPRLLTYDKSVDIWTFGKILQDLVSNVPSRGKTVPVNKEPALRLIHRMMQEDPKKRPTAAECLEDPWMTTYDHSNSLPAQKRNRSPTPSTEPAFKKVVRRTLGDSFTTDECVSIMNAILADESEYQNGSGQGSRRVLAPSDIQMEECRATQLTIRLGEGGRMSFTTHDHNGSQILESLIIKDENILPSVLADNTGPQGASPSMQVLARRLLEALHAEGYGNNVTVAGKSTDMIVVRDELSRLSISSIQVRQKSENSIMLGLEFESDGAEWANSSWNKRCSVDNNIDPQSAYLDRNVTAPVDDAARPCTFLEVMFSQYSSLLDEPEPANGLHQLFLPTITLNDDQGGVRESSSLHRAITVQAISLAKSSVTSIGSNSILSSQRNKGITYPSEYDDIMAGLS